MLQNHSHQDLILEDHHQALGMMGFFSNPSSNNLGSLQPHHLHQHDDDDDDDGHDHHAASSNNSTHDLSQSLLISYANQNPRDFHHHQDPSSLMGMGVPPHLLSIQRSNPSNPWEWRSRARECMASNGAALVEDHNMGNNNNNNSKKSSLLGISALRMKKMKGRRKVREPRFCFKTLSDVDVLDDGYKWRKYGQKVVKNTQHPRSYYRCTQDNCRVKKRVERLAEDPRMVITTYEGRHVHSPSPDNPDDDSNKSLPILNNFFWPNHPSIKKQSKKAGKRKRRHFVSDGSNNGPPATKLKDESSGELPSEACSDFHVQHAELRQESIVTELKTMMDDAEAKNIISMSEATYGLQLVEQLHQQSGEDELSEETTFANTKTVLDPDEVENTTPIDMVSNPPPLVEEVDQQDNETEISVPSSELSNKIIELSAETISDHDEVENTTPIDLMTNPLQLVEEVHQQDNETKISVPSAELSNKIIELSAETLTERDEFQNITSAGQETCLGKDSETEVAIPAVEGTEKLVDAETKSMSKDDEVENIIQTDPPTIGLQIAEEPLQDNEARFIDDSVVVNMKPVLNNDEIENSISTGQATVGPHLAEDLIQQVNESESGFLGKISLPLVETEVKVVFVSNSKEVVMVEDEKEAEELESLNVIMNQKLKRIEEIAEQVTAIDTEIPRMESECSESKSKHAEFIDLFKLIVESQLPLRSHREINQLIKRKDKAAQEWLSIALDLQVKIDARAKLKLALQEESAELAKLVEAHKLQIHQKLKETDQVIKLDEAVDSGMDSPYSKIKFTYTRKRKSINHDGHLVEGDFSSSEMQTKRIALNTVGDSLQGCIDHGMVTDP